MNRIDKLFTEKKEKVLNVYFTAGYPNLDDTVAIIEELDKAGADMVEIGMPFSDPVADGPVIQLSSHVALQNGMSVELLFKQLRGVRAKTSMPIVLMGYLNPVLQYGVSNFCKSCREVGVDGLILPDLPPELYQEQYQEIFEQYGLKMILLVPPQTSDARIKQLDSWSGGFLYIVAASSTTGAKGGFEPYQIDYFERLKKLNLSTPRLVGFGISSNDTFTAACQYANGAIIGSAFIKALEKEGTLENKISNFVKSITGEK